MKTPPFTLLTEDPDIDDTALPERHFLEEGELGAGGAAIVKQVFDPRMLRRTALKALKRSHHVDQETISRFIDEAQITGQLEHPGVVPVYEFGIDTDGELYLNMKLINGRSLEQIIDAAGTDRLRPDRLGKIVEILLKVCDALSYAHSRGVIHRDIKPANVMVGDFGQVYLLDWGIALVRGTDERAVTLTRESPNERDLKDIFGTPAFMAPEQAQSMHIDERTDVFGLGGLLYYALTGTPTYGNVRTSNALFRAISGQIEPPPEVEDGHAVPRTLAKIAMRALAYNSESRFESAQAFREALEKFLRGTWHMPSVIYKKGDLVFSEGDSGQTAYVIARGRCHVFTTQDDGSRKILRLLDQGDVFGETAIFTDQPRSASVEALCETELLQVTQAALTDGLGLHSWMGRFVTVLAHRFRDVDERLRTLQDQIKETTE
jgi:serine/threonine-protein kinase